MVYVVVNNQTVLKQTPVNWQGAHVMSVFIIRRKGVVLETTEPVTEPDETAKPKRVKRNLAAERATKGSPKRKDLTPAQWREWGTGLRTLRTAGVPKAERLSLAAQRDLLDTIKWNVQLFTARALQQQ